MVSTCPQVNVVEKSLRIQYDPCCPAYHMLEAPVKSFGSSAVAVGDDEIYLLGGYTTSDGHEVFTNETKVL